MITLFDKPFNLAAEPREINAVATTIWLLTYHRSNKDPVWDRAELEVLRFLMEYEADLAKTEKRPRSLKFVLERVKEGPDGLESILNRLSSWSESTEDFKQALCQELASKLTEVCAAPTLKAMTPG